MLDHDGPAGQALGKGGGDILLVEDLQHLGLGQTDGTRHAGGHQGEDRQDEVGRALVAADGQDVQPHAEDQDEQGAQPEGRHGGEDQGEVHREPVKERVLFDGA